MTKGCIAWISWVIDPKERLTKKGIGVPCQRFIAAMESSVGNCREGAVQKERYDEKVRNLVLISAWRSGELNGGMAGRGPVGASARPYRNVHAH